MNLFKVMEERLKDEGVFNKLKDFYNALVINKDDESIKEIVEACNVDCFYVRYNESESNDQYEVGEIVIEFDDESKLYPYTYTIQLSHISCSNTYLPKIKIEKNELLKAFVAK